MLSGALDTRSLLICSKQKQLGILAVPYSLQCVMRKVDKLSNLAIKTDPLQFKMQNIAYKTELFDVVQSKHVTDGKPAWAYNGKSALAYFDFCLLRKQVYGLPYAFLEPTQLSFI